MLPLMQSSKEADIIAFRCYLDHLGRPVTEAFLLGINQIMRWSLYSKHILLYSRNSGKLRYYLDH